VIARDRQANVKEPYVYLYVIGVSPHHQGKGIGTHLVISMLNHISPDIPIYLETETERNVRFCERLGFNIVKMVNIPNLDLPIWEMLLTRK
jgi:ribosomal protein S18 acetylase RimI-like enzyme